MTPAEKFARMEASASARVKSTKARTSVARAWDSVPPYPFVPAERRRYAGRQLANKKFGMHVPKNYKAGVFRVYDGGKRPPERVHGCETLEIAERRAGQLRDAMTDAEVGAALDAGWNYQALPLKRSAKDQKAKNAGGG